MDIPFTAEGRASHDEDNFGSGDGANGTLTQGAAGADPTSQAQDVEDNKFQRAISVWRGIDLTSLVPKLDITASDIVAHQRDSLVQRKDLAQKTKDFRKLDDAGKLSEYKSLLKAYQTFIDLLTNQGKQSSSAFLQVYSSISEAPDPYPLLEASVDSLVLSEDTVPKLNSEKEHLQRSNNKLTSQLEDTERRLEEERTARKQLEDNQDTKIKGVEASWSAVLEEKTNNWEAKERSLEDKVENQERLLREIKASYEVTQRLGHDNDGSQDASRSTAQAAELEMVSADLEKTSLRLAEIEARNEQLRIDLAQAVSQTRDTTSQSVEDDPAYQRLQSENSSLLRKLDSTRFDKDSALHTWESKTRQLERQSSQLASEKDELRRRLDQWADYDEIKRELEVIKSIEFATGDDDDGLERNQDNVKVVDMNGSAVKDKKESLEQLLLARNKKLGDELTLLRVSHQDLQRRLESMQEDLSRTNAELEKSQNLSATLENDLLRVQEEAANALPPSAMSVAGTYSSRYPQGGRRGRSSPTSSIISGFDPSTRTPPSTMESLRAGEAYGGGSGILPMIQAQRDRFKQKNSQLEEELAKTYSTVSTLRQEVTSLQKDNLNLYEKTRYVSTYNRGPTSSSSAYANNPNPSTIQVSSEDRYRSVYEANISPFAAFRGRETARAYKKMSLPERIIFSITRMVLANRTSRNLFAGYCLALHILVFVMLYWMGTVDIEKHASNLGEAVSTVAGAGAAGLGGGGAGEAVTHHGDWQQEGFNQGR